MKTKIVLAVFAVWLGLTIGIYCMSFAATATSAPSSAADIDAKTNAARSSKELLETGSFAPNDKALKAAKPETLKIVSYNIRWRGGEDLEKLIKTLKEDKQLGGAHIVGLQEVDRDCKRTGNVNTARKIAEALKMSYVWAAPPNTKASDEEETGVTILSVFPLRDAERIILPHPGPGERRRAAVGASVVINDKTAVRVYSLHAETRIAVKKKIEQYSSVLHAVDARAQTSEASVASESSPRETLKRAIVLGDFNSIGDDAVEETDALFKRENFSTPFPNNITTWKRLFLKFKLDWVWLRGFGAVRDFGIRKDVGLSDHYPLWLEVEL